MRLLDGAGNSPFACARRSALAFLVITLHAQAAFAAQIEVPFDSFEDLKVAKVLRPGGRYTVLGHRSADDGAGDAFVFQATKPATEVPGVTYEVPGRGYLIRQGFNSRSPVRAEWFGAKGDGVSDDRAAIQAALDGHSRVNLMSKSYGLGKGLYIGWCNNEGTGWRKCLGQGGSFSLTVRSNYRILGAGRDQTKLKLLDNTNPRLKSDTGGVYDIIGNSMTNSAPNVEIRDLTIDVNFDGQSKAAQAPADSLLDPTTGNMVTSPNPGEVATLNAIRVHGPNALFENLRVVGFSSNTFQEAFVVSSGLVFKDSTVGRQCATIRNVEMTNPGSNLEIKYRRFGGAAGLRKNDVHVAEITHISVSGAHNFTNQPWSYGSYSIPADHPDWQANSRRQFATLQAALSSFAGKQVRPSSTETPKVIEITTPEPVQYRYDERSETPPNNLTVISPHKAGITQPQGRLIRHATKTNADYAFKSEKALLAAIRGIAPSQRHNKIFQVDNPSPEYYRVDPSIPGLEGDGVRIFSSEGNLFVLTRIQGNTGSCTSGWGCDPGFDPTYLGENAANAWWCEGGVIENVYIHDEITNPQGLSADGKQFGLSQEEVKRTVGSHIHGISVALTDNLVIRNNRIKNFMGPAVFNMSWWNNRLVVRDNYFDGVLYGALLVSMIESDPSTPNRMGRPFQFSRHQNIAIVNNYIRMIENSNTYAPSALRIDDQSNGATFVDGATKVAAMPQDEFPRFENIRFAYNRVVGREVLHGDKKRIMYPVGADIASASYLKNVRIWRNSFDITPDPRFANVKSGTAIRLSPGHFYQTKDEKRHLIAVYENTDLRGQAGWGHISGFQNLSRQPSPPATSAYPLLLKGDGETFLGLGDERT